jgi:hypothetical protein
LARKTQQQASTTFGDTQNVYGNAGQESNNLYDTLFPEYQAEATNPQGFGSKDLAEMKTNAEQSVGGSTAGAVGQGELEAARNRNSGGEAAALDQSAEEGDQALSSADLGIDTANAELKQQQQQAGIAGEAGLYGTTNSDMLQALGLGTGAVNAETQAGSQGWLQNLTGVLNSVKGAGTTTSGGATYTA